LKVLMFKPRQAGFTLIEIVLVMAVTGMIFVIAFVGQRGLRAQAEFDAAVDKMVASIADARNQATAGVNLQGAGEGSNKCGGGPNPGTLADARYSFAGTSWTADNALADGIVKFDYYEAFYGDPDDSGKSPTACIFQTQKVTVPSTLRVNVSSPLAQQGGRVLYVRTSNGGLTVCWVADLTVDVLPSFQSASCTAGATLINTTSFPIPPKLTFSDADGHTSDVTIDGSGLAKRAN
jgi:prepilin-type N-terminal cleavage/methylation domain-containing protein